MISIAKCLLGVFLYILVWNTEAEGGTINALSCSRNDVQAAINSANVGDTVEIPSGNCTWSSKIVVTKSISIIGGGIGNTVITDGVSGDNLIELGNSSSTIAPRLSGMTIKGSASKSGFKAMIQLAGLSSGLGFRIDHISFYHWTNEAIQTWDGVWGVIDHCNFTENGGGYAIYFRHDRWNGVGDWGDNSWADADGFGTYKFVFIEDSTFSTSASSSVVYSDSCGGARYVYRYNTFNNGNIRSHGTDSTPRVRGTRSVEVYNNAFENNLSGGPHDTVFEYRSGTLLFYNNTISGSVGFDWGPALRLNRNSGTTWWPPCTGSFALDKNQPGLSGYLCLDQPGAGQADYFSEGNGGSNGWTGISPYTWPNQASSPVFMWNNTGYNVGEGGGSDIRIQANRDYYLSPKQGYTAYTYPHPLQGGGPAVPTNLRILLQ